MMRPLALALVTNIGRFRAAWSAWLTVVHTRVLFLLLLKSLIASRRVHPKDRRTSSNEGGEWFL